MVLSYLISQYLLQPESIHKDFNVTEWNLANRDFYVPPHPLLYLLYLKPKTFLLVTASNLLLPAAYGHLVHLVVLAGTIVIQPITGTYSSNRTSQQNKVWIGIKTTTKKIHQNVFSISFRFNEKKNQNSNFAWLSDFHFAILVGIPCI